MRKCSCFWMVAILVLIFSGPQAIAQARAKKKIEVIVFLGADCPISQDYIGILNKLKNEYPNARFLGVLPSSNNHEKKLFKREHQVEFDLRIDRRKKLVKQFDITVTPEVILVDSTGRICYKGAIDNWYYELGHHRPQASEFYLSNAIKDLMAGRQVVVSRTKAIGCILSRMK